MGFLLNQFNQNKETKQTSGKVDFFNAKKYITPEVALESDRSLEAFRLRQEQEKQNEIIKKQQDAVNAFNERQRQIQEGNIVTKGLAGIKSFLGYAPELPEIQGGSPEYNAQQQATKYQNEYGKQWAGRAGNAIADFVNDKYQADKTSREQFGNSPLGRMAGNIKTDVDYGVGIAKNVAELASGTAKLAVGLTPASGFSTIRKITSFVGGKPVEEFLDRNTPEYFKKVDAQMDDMGILNYHPKYANEIQQTGGDVAEIGSWFIPITRLGKVAKGEELLSSAIRNIPKVQQILGVTPKVVKVGSKYAYEVSKDVVDVGILDAIRGKDWNTIEEDMQMAGVGGAVLRGVLGAGGSVVEKLNLGRENKILLNIKNGLGDLKPEEEAFARTAIKEGRAVDEISTDLMVKREQAGEDLIKQITEKKPTEQVLPEKEVNPMETPKQPTETSVADTKPANADTSATVATRPVEQKKPISDTKTPTHKEVPVETHKTEAQKEIPNYPVEMKVSKQAKDLEKKGVEEGIITKGEEKLATYRPLTIEGDLGNARKVISSSVDDARAIIRGEKPLPNDISNGESLYVEMGRYMDTIKDPVKKLEILKEMLSSPYSTKLSEGAQTMRVAQERSEFSAEKVVKDISAEWDKKSGFDATAETEKVMKEFRKDIEFKIEDARDILKSLVC